MADFSDLYAGNPYLQPAQPPDKLAVIGQMLTGLGAGISGASARGMPWHAGIAPGAGMAMGMLSKQRESDFNRRMQMAQLAQMGDMRKLQAENIRSQIAERDSNRMMDEGALAYLQGGGGVPGFNVAQGPQMGPFNRAIGGIESGGNYGAIGPVANAQGHRAYGKYQVLEPNIGPWTQEVLGRAYTPQEFLKDEKAQDAVFNTKFGQYAQKYGPNGAARAWFAGEGGMNNPNARDVLGTTVAGYGRKFDQSVAQGDTTPQPSGTMDPRAALPLLQSKRFAPLGKGMIDLGNAEADRRLQQEKLDREMEMKRREIEQKERNDRIGPSGTPNTTLLDADALKALSESEMKRYSEKVRPAAEEAAGGLNNLYQMKRLTEGNMASGTAIDARMFGARVLDTIGVRPMPDGMVNTTEFINRASKQTLDILKSGALGSGTGISGKDLDFVNEMSAKRSDFTKEELSRLVDIAIDSSHGTLKKHDQTVARFKGGLPGASKLGDEYWKIDAPSYDDWKKANPPTNAAPPAAAQEAPSIPQPKSKEEFDALPKGTTFIDPQGNKRVKP